MAPKQIEPASTSLRAVEGWFTTGRFALILGALIIVSFPQVIFGFETFWVRDYCGFGYPLAFYGQDRLSHLEIPLWNPLNNCGLPFLAQWNTMVLYPGMWLCFLFPLSWSLGVFCLAHLFVAGLGMYFLARDWTNHRLAASVAGVAFAFNGLTWTALMWPNNIAALGWMPWVVVTVERAWKGGRRELALAGLAGAMQMLCGAPEIIALTWFLIAGLGIRHFCANARRRSYLLLSTLGLVTLVAGLAAAQLLPFLDLLAHSSRSSNYAASQLGPEWAMPVGGLANFLVPLFHYYKFYYGDWLYYQFGQYWVTSYYVGIGTILLALLGVFRAGKDSRIWLLVALMAVCFWLAMGKAGGVYPRLLHLLPVLGFMRFPVKFVVIGIIILPLIASVGLGRWFEVWGDRKRGLISMPYWIAAAMLVVMSLIVWQAFGHPSPKELPADTLRSAAGRAGFLLACVGMFEALRRVPSFRLQVLLGIGVLFLFWFDVFTHQPQLSPSIERVTYTPNVIRQFFHWETELQPGEARAMQTARSYTLLYNKSGTNVVEDMQVRRLALFLNRNLLEGIAKTDGFYSLELPQVSRVFDAIGIKADSPRLEDFLGVTYVSSPSNYVDWIKRDTARPVITAGEQPVFMDDEAVLRGLADDSLDPTRNVYLPPAAGNQAEAKMATPAKVTSHSFAAQQLTATVETPSPAWVVIAQAYYHPWRAYVDGKSVTLWRANYAFQALEVPAGRHEVRLVYQDRAFEAGTVVSGLALLVCGCLWWLGGRRGIQATATAK